MNRFLFFLPVFFFSNTFSVFSGLRVVPDKVSFSTSDFRFTENKGQVKSVEGLNSMEVLYYLHTRGFDVYLQQGGYSYQFTKHSSGILTEDLSLITERFEISLIGADINAPVSVEGKSEDYLNFPSAQIAQVHSYEKITYHNIYPGIDWVVFAREGKIKDEFIVHPGADPSNIKLQYKYVNSLSLDAKGQLCLHGRIGKVQEGRVQIFQGTKQISGNYQINKGNVVSFGIGKYDPEKELIIDPTLQWATYYGSTGEETTQGCVTDAAGNIYLSGYTQSTSSFASGGYQVVIGGGWDAFLVKFSSSGARLWATYFGGTANDFASCCAVDASGNVYLAGTTGSQTNIAMGGYQNVSGGMNDAYLAKFDASGNLIWCTYYGGTGNDGGSSCAVASTGDVYLTGTSMSADNIAMQTSFQSTNAGGNDMFVVKFSSAGSRLWSSYIGGPGDDRNYYCAVDNVDNIYLCGFTTSTLNMAFGGHQTSHGGGNNDAFLAKFSASGSLQWSTYYGGSLHEAASGCCVDPNNNVYLLGTTASTNNISFGGFSNTIGGSSDCFLAKFNSSGTRIWATYYGGAGAEGGGSCTTDAAGNVYISGSTGSTAGISFLGHQNTFGGQAYDAMLVKFNPSGNRTWATYYGGNSLDYGSNCWVDAQRNVYLAGNTISFNNIASGGFQNTHSPGLTGDCFLAKFCSEPDAPPVSGNLSICDPGNQTYSVTLDPYAQNYFWLISPGYTMTSVANMATVNVMNSNTIGAVAVNLCGNSPVSVVNVTVLGRPVISAPSGSVCLGQSFSVSPSGASSYSINGGAFVVTPTVTSSYSVAGTSTAGCVSTSSAIITVTVFPYPAISVNSGSICQGATFTIVPSGASTYSYSGGTNQVSPASSTNYSVVGTNTNGCISIAPAVSSVIVMQNPNVSVNVNPQLMCIGSTATISGTGAGFYVWSNNLATPILTVAPPANTVYQYTGYAPNGCSTSGSVLVQVVPLPLIQIVASRDTVCEGEEVLLVASGALNYNWASGPANDSLKILGAIGGSAYMVTGTDANGCAGSASYKIQVEICTGLRKNHLNEANLYLFPNPADDRIFIPESSGDELLLIDATGKTLHTWQLQGQHFLNVSFLPPGLYFTELRNNGISLGIHKLIIAR